MPWARVRAAVAGVLGAPDEAPFDRVLVSAMATRLPGGAGRPAGRARHPRGAGGGADAAGASATPSAPDGRRVTEHGHYRFVPLVTD